MSTSHRLTLTVAELSLLAAETGVDLPLPAAEETDPADEWFTGAEVGLRRRGLLDGAGTPIPSVAANLAVLGSPQVTVRTEIALDDRTEQTLHTLAGGLGASLIHRKGDEVELALFPAWEFGAELTRAVPLVAAVPTRVEGRLRSVVRAADGTVLGEVVWTATGEGWAGAGGELVQAVDLASSLEPHLTAALNAAH